MAPQTTGSTDHRNLQQLLESAAAAPEPKPGLVFLIANDQVLYVARGIDALRTLYRFASEPIVDFDRYVIRYYPKPELARAQADYVELLQPDYNLNGLPKGFRSRGALASEYDLSRQAIDVVLAREPKIQGAKMVRLDDYPRVIADLQWLRSQSRAIESHGWLREGGYGEWLRAHDEDPTFQIPVVETSELDLPPDDDEDLFA